MNEAKWRIVIAKNFALPFLVYRPGYPDAVHAAYSLAGAFTFIEQAHA